MIASGLLWYDDDTHRPLALKLAEAAQRYRERVGYEPTTCQLNPSQAPAATLTAESATNATPKRVSARRGSRKATANLPPITLALIPDAGLRPNYFFVGVADGEPLKRASIFRDDDSTDDLQPRIPATRQRSKNTTTKPGNISGKSGNSSGNGAHRTTLPHAGEGAGREVHPAGNTSGNHPTAVAQPTLGQTLAIPQSAPEDFAAHSAPRRGFNRPPSPRHDPANDTNNTSGNSSSNSGNSGNSSGNTSRRTSPSRAGEGAGGEVRTAKTGKRAKAATPKPEMPATVATPPTTQPVTAAPAESASPRKTRLPAKTAKKTAKTSPNATPAVEPKAQAKAAATPATSSRPSIAAPAPAAQITPTKTKKAAKTAKVPATSSRPTTAAPASATKQGLPAKTAATETSAPKSQRSTTNQTPIPEKKKAAKPAPAASASPAETQPAPRSAKIPATRSAKPAKSSGGAEHPTKAAIPLPASATTPTSMPSVLRPGRRTSRRNTAEESSRPVVATHPTAPKPATPVTARPKPKPAPNAAQANLWGEPVSSESRRKTRRTA